MENFKTAKELRSAIQTLEVEQFNRRVLLKEEVLTLCESLKPINIVKDTIKEFNADSELKSGVFNNVAGWIVGLISKKFFVGSSNLLTKSAGNVIENVVANKVAKNADRVKAFIVKILGKIVGKSEYIYEDNE